MTVFGWSVVGTAGVLAVTFAVQCVLAPMTVGTVWDKLGRRRPLPSGFSRDAAPPAAGDPGSLRWAGTFGRKSGDLTAFAWAEAQTEWGKEAERIRSTFLLRTQSTAEKWRTIFAGLLAVFGAVLLVDPQLPEGQTLDAAAYYLVMGALVLGAQAVAYTGWAAAGLPKMMVDVDAETAFVETTSHAARSLARLRIGLVCGALSALALVLAAGYLLAPAT
ncbi:hypothetical protein [Cellulosimicrobium sp. Marseille-Q4280]|uniref:hypothetical protein n=1 Tax=Cellulosimicrobium sp. Marseille-Q4280 TaxID=2937992 RepID=UPI00203DB6DB|nr:hypothetical protein [Cellulosimicrobium sp. Marseille-Q4280]